MKHGGRALLVGDISGAEHVLLLQYDLGNTRWELLNPAFGGDTTAFGASLANDAAASNGRTTLGLGTSATVNTGTSGATIPLLNGANTWSALQSLTEAITLDDWQTIASANGTTDIGAATSNLVAVSGTNSITGWGTVAAGTWRIVRATGGWNVTFAATLVGPSGETSGTHTATSGNLYIIVSQGGGTWNMGMLSRERPTKRLSRRVRIPQPPSRQGGRSFTTLLRKRGAYSMERPRLRFHAQTTTT